MHDCFGVPVNDVPGLLKCYKKHLIGVCNNINLSKNFPNLKFDDILLKQLESKMHTNNNDD